MKWLTPRGVRLVAALLAVLLLGATLALGPPPDVRAALLRAALLLLAP